MVNIIKTFRPACRRRLGPARMFFILCLLTTSLFYLTSAGNMAIAANHHIRDGASGDGTDWTNAWDDLPADLTRGDTYYIADGNYKGHLFSDAEDGEKYIYIKKAIESDHGTDSGWSSTYGDGVANWVMDTDDPVFKLNFRTSYYVFDGQVGGGPGSWDSGHGFHVYLNDSLPDYRCLILLGDGSTDTYTPNYITVKHTKFSAPKWNVEEAVQSIGDYKFTIVDSGPSNHIYSYNHFYNIERPLNTRECSNWTFEYNFVQGNDCIPHESNQGTAWQDYGSDDMIIRYNLWENIEGTGVIDMKRGVPPDASFSGWKVYGNVFYYKSGVDYPYGDVYFGCANAGVFGSTDAVGATGYVSNMAFHNNVVIGITGTNQFVGFYGVDNVNNVAYNNLFYGCTNLNPVGVDYNYNIYIDTDWGYGTAGPNEFDVDYPDGSDPFVDWVNKDFRLKSSTEPGLTLPAPYNYDMFNVERGSDGNWDRGAYEYRGPVLENIGDKSVDENDTLTINVIATDPDGDPITYAAQNLPGGATFVDKTFSWTPSYEQAGTYQVTFTASDGPEYDSETITITVNNVNVNRAPVLEPIGDQSVDENDDLAFTVNATDPDLGDNLSFTLSNNPGFVSLTDNGDGTGSLDIAPGYDDSGSYPAVRITVTDDGIPNEVDYEDITITVINVNQHTDISDIPDTLTKYVGQTITTNEVELAQDPDVGDTLTYTYSGWLTSLPYTITSDDVGTHILHVNVSDGTDITGKDITITVGVDILAPTVTNCSPTDESIEVPLNNLISLNITDADTGVYADSVIIRVNGNRVYAGDTAHYNSLYGDCRRTGTRAAYSFFYQSNETFDYDQTVTITVNATDLAGHVMNEYSYSFATEMRSFGQNKKVNSGLDNNDRPVTVCDSDGNIWAAWHAGPIGNRDIYVSILAAGEENFGDTVQLTGDATDQCNPAVALDSNDKLYVVWQDNRQGNWDIYISTSVDGINWSSETMVHDPNDRHQVNPAIVIDGQSPNQAHVVWQDDRAGNQDIFVATSSDGFVTKTVSQITSDIFDQVEPAVAADSVNTIYVVWTDGRNSSNDIYGAASNNGPWTNVAIVSNTYNQSNPAIAAESAGSILHLLWVDDTSGDNDIYYASSNGLLDCPLTGSSIIDDSKGADQLEPTIAVTGSTGDVFTCWQDWRNTDTDLYFVELSYGAGPNNVFVGDDDSNTYQGGPVIGIDEYEYDHPYLVWADSRSTDIYYAGSTYVDPVPLASELVLALASNDTIVGTDPENINSIDDVSVTVPAGACSFDVEITISRIRNPRAFAVECLAAVDFGPSGMQFNPLVPVTITIPYAFSGSDGSLTPYYWFTSSFGVGTLSQEGITDIQDIPISSTLHALSFKTIHFTAFYMFGEGAAAPGGGGGGGGCSVSASGEGNIVEFILPYIGFVVVLAILTVRDARVRKARNMAAGKC